VKFLHKSPSITGTLQVPGYHCTTYESPFERLFLLANTARLSFLDTLTRTLCGVDVQIGRTKVDLIILKISVEMWTRPRWAGAASGHHRSVDRWRTQAQKNRRIKCSKCICIAKFLQAYGNPLRLVWVTRRRSSQRIHPAQSCP